ncbi:uncharacterized protein C8Q71DRAFT_859028 [Rhodofomes roseus]|uniref:Fungal-type protein kinase domain-containing protein n=1 Tax=Rhodofomes roseus TaxID=34475 RepID=A0ABQ8KE19_9APHY|nr:uncharacterized protein C8Q71DRAFT_859028 [Rhodofomes roseus]KAH9835398.1 hypothetical protein C8Q71DRAFT_859028 [Rhodofomes roseus]
MHPKISEIAFDDFLERFMPGPDMPAKWAKEIPGMSTTVLMETKETNICDELCKVAQPIFDHCPHGDKLAAKNTSHTPDDSHCEDYSEKLKVDVSFYPVDDDAKGDYTRPELTGSHAATRWAWISLLVEVKTAQKHCAFDFEDEKVEKKDVGRKKAVDGGEDGGGDAEHRDGPQESAAVGRGQGHATDDGDPPTPRPFVRTGEAAERALGCMGKYIAKLLRRQHRLHIFTLYVFKGQVRVLRSDRAGTIVSTPVNFEADPSLLHKVLWRYACMNQVERGFDPTVTRATVEEIEAMRSCPAMNNAAGAYRDAALDQPGWPVYKITMRRGDLIDQRSMQPIADEFYEPEELSIPEDRVGTSDEVCFIVGKHRSATNSPAGRGMRGYIAYDVSRRRLVFLKDYWRPCIKSSLFEGEVLHSLRSVGVRYVPTPLAAGIVQDEMGVQETCTQDFLPVDERTGCYAPRQEHYRLVVKEIGEPLEEHKSPYELVKVIWHALYGHRQAWELKELLHRDISAGNILILRYIDKNGKMQSIGILIDWDLCKDKKYLETVLRPSRAGTWQFMSARLLRNPGKRHEVADDLESSIHVLHWILFRFVEHSLTGIANILKSRILCVYEEQGFQKDDQYKAEIGGAQKLESIRSGRPAIEVDRGTPLGRLLQRLATLCQQHYYAVEPVISSKSKSSSALAGARPVSHEALPNLRNRFNNDIVRNRTLAAPKVDAYEALSNHVEVFGAFWDALCEPLEEWAKVTRTDDQFDEPEFRSSDVSQYSDACSSQRSSRSRRSLESESVDTERAGRFKRARTTTTGLQSSTEESVVARDEA